MAKTTSGLRSCSPACTERSTCKMIIGRHSFAIVACTALIGGFGYFCANYMPLYRRYHVQRDIFTNETVFHGGGGGGGGGGGNFTNGTADATSKPCIGSPIGFLVVNFVYSYAVLVIVIRLYDLYAWPATTTGGRTPLPPEMPCCGRHRSPETHPEPDITDSAEPAAEHLAVWTADDYRSCSDRRCRADYEPATQTAGVCSGQKSWDGDWNKYWNDKCDF